jgi:hypothetical protein
VESSFEMSEVEVSSASGSAVERGEPLGLGQSLRRGGLYRIAEKGRKTGMNYVHLLTKL